MSVDLVDTHAHIQSAGGTPSGERSTREIWAKDPNLTGDTLVAAATEAGVTRLICVGCDLADSELVVEFVQDRPHAWASIGLHPHEAQHYFGQDDKLARFTALVTDPKVVAVGECGLDYFYEHSPREAQTAILQFQIELALKADKPIIFHVRGAFDDFWPIFDQYQGIRGVLHSFTDNAENLAKAMERGLYIGVNGIATFAKDPAQLEVYRSIPLDRLVLETDAPFLTPTPYRGTINQPKYVRVISEFVANLRGIDHAQLAAATTQNAIKLFGLN